VGDGDRVDGWAMIDIRDAVRRGAEQGITIALREHLPNQHDQQAHAGTGSGGEPLPRNADAIIATVAGTDIMRGDDLAEFSYGEKRNWEKVRWGQTLDYKGEPQLTFLTPFDENLNRLHKQNMASAKHDPKDGVPPATKRVVERSQEMTHTVNAATLNMSVDEYRQKLDTHVKTLVSDAMESGGVFIRVREGTLDKILDEGRFKSQFETNRSGGSLANESRNRVESTLYGYDKNTNPERRPIYGYLTADGQGRLRPGAKAGPKALEESEEWLDGYGNVAVRLKSEIADRTTVTFGDSLAFGQSFGFAPTPLRAPSHISVNARGHMGIETKGMLEKRLARKDEETGWNPFSAKRVDDHPLGINYGGVDGYTEVQMHGGVRVSDIAEVILDRKSVV